MTSRWIVRALLVALLSWQTYVAVRATVYYRAYVAGVRAYGAGDWSGAAERFREALDQRDSDATTWAWLGDSARPAFEIARSRGARETELRAWLDRAFSGYAGAVLRAPVDAWSWSGLGEVLALESDWEDSRRGVDLATVTRRAEGILDARRAAALAASRLAVRLKPSGYQELDALAAAYGRAGMDDEARATLVRSARMMPVPSFHVWGERERFAPESYAVIAAALREGAARVPAYDRSLISLEIAIFARRQGDLTGALAFLGDAERAASTEYEQFQVDSETARVLAELGRDAEAVSRLDRARAAGLDPEDILVRLGTLQQRLGRNDQACGNLQHALQLTPNTNLRLAAAEACRAAGEVDSAERILRDGFVLPTDDMVVARALIEFYRRTGRERSADGLLRTWSEQFPGRSEFSLWLRELTGETTP